MCPDENQLAALAEGTLDPDAVAELERHLDACPACLGVVADLARFGRDDAPGLPKIGRYEVLRELGSGGQGVVFAAFDPDLRRQVAVKIVRPDRDPDPARLQREARLLASLSHAHVVPVFEVGSYPGGVYLVTELARGGTLRERIGRPWREVLPLFVQAGRGLAAAHRAGLVHRDVKPDNVLVHEDGRAMLTDFGLGSDGSSSESGSGTPGYLAPERIRGAPADARSDQYAFCASAWEALHGELPFVGRSLRELADASVGRRFGGRRAGVPRAIDRALERGLSADPAARFPSVDALLDALEQAAAPARPGGVALAASALAAGVAVAAGIGWFARSAAPVAPVAPAPPAVVPAAVVAPPPDLPAPTRQPVRTPPQTPLPAPPAAPPTGTFDLTRLHGRTCDENEVLVGPVPDCADDVCRAQRTWVASWFVGCYDREGRCADMARWAGVLADGDRERRAVTLATGNCTFDEPLVQVYALNRRLGKAGATVEHWLEVAAEARRLAGLDGLTDNARKSLWTAEVVCLGNLSLLGERDRMRAEAELAWDVFHPPGYPTKDDLVGQLEPR